MFKIYSRAACCKDCKVKSPGILFHLKTVCGKKYKLKLVGNHNCGCNAFVLIEMVCIVPEA